MIYTARPNLTFFHWHPFRLMYPRTLSKRTFLISSGLTQQRTLPILLYLGPYPSTSGSIATQEDDAHKAFWEVVRVLPYVITR